MSGKFKNFGFPSAGFKPSEPDAATRREALLELLRDGQPHGGLEMRRVCGHHHGARLHELRQRGCVVECLGKGADGFGIYRLLSEDGPVRTEAVVRVELTHGELQQLFSTGRADDGTKAKLADAWKRVQVAQRKLDALQPPDPRTDDLLELLQPE